MKTIEPIICATLQNAGIHFTHDAGRKIFHFNMSERNIDYMVLLGYDEGRSLIRCFMRIPVNVPEHRVILVLTAINLYNAQEIFGAMFLSDERDSLFVRTYANVDDGAINETIVWGLIYPCQEMMNQFYDTIMKIIYSETILSN